jgi:hypothetical protein
MATLPVRAAPSARAKRVLAGVGVHVLCGGIGSCIAACQSLRSTRHRAFMAPIA